MSCSEFTPRLELMADDEVSSDLAAQTLAHIDDCAACREQWYGILNLKKAIKEKAQSYHASPDFESRIIEALRKESTNKVVSFKRDQILAYVAALVGVIVAAAVLIKPASQHTTKAESVLIQKPAVVASQAALAPATLEEAMTYFDKYVKTSNGVNATNNGGEGASDKQKIDSISSAAGFAVKPMSLPGFKLKSAYMANLGADNKPVVALCYSRIVNRKTDHIICYQAPGGKLVAAGLNEHLIDGKKICCGEKGDRAIVYIPYSEAPTVLLLSTISKSDLMDLVLSDS
jgi:hypothetical protein